MEKIQTGLTANYVHDWSISQGIKEAMQNIAYGSVKCGSPAKMYFDGNAACWSIADRYIGLDKRHLYIGESGQREDDDGLGTFGEGWKLFLLIMARNSVKHLVRTVGFSFWGTMEATPHGVEALVINIEPNDIKRGTKVSADVNEQDWRRAANSFGTLRGLDPELFKESQLLPELRGELFVQGVRIENGDDINPLDLYYAYNLNHRNLINRDRSHVDNTLVTDAIKKLVYRLQGDEVDDYIEMALRGKQESDIFNGPSVPVSDSTGHKRVWLDALARQHGCSPSRLAIPSYNPATNDAVKREGYTLLEVPSKWHFEVSYLGIKSADDVVEDRYDIVEEHVHVSNEAKSAFAKAKKRLKKAFQLSSVSELPEFRYVEDIRNSAGESKLAHYDLDLEIMYVDVSIMEDETELVSNLLPEMVIWEHGADADIEAAYQYIILELLGL